MPRLRVVPFAKSFTFKPTFEAASHKIQCLHLYRHLLRECTYLPDEAARKYVWKQVVLRFRKNASKKKRWLLEQSPPHIPILSVRLSRGQTILQMLKDANEGCPRSVLRVLQETYGRTGMRRLWWMRDLAFPDRLPLEGEEEFHNGKGLENYSSPYDIPSQYHRVFIPQPPKDNQVKFKLSARFERLKALAESQVQLQRKFTRMTTSNLKDTTFSIPTMNIWYRPMPWKRVKNMITRRYKRMMEQLYAPMPEKEWNRLRDLATGKATWPGLITRRIAPPETPEKFTAQVIEKILFAEEHRNSLTTLDDNISTYSHTYNIRKLNLQDQWMKEPKMLDQASYRLLEEELDLIDRTPERGEEKNNPRKLSRRAMRRLWAKVFEHCPMLYKDEATSKWKVTWGIEVLHAKGEKVPQVQKLFDMVYDKESQKRIGN